MDYGQKIRVLVVEDEEEIRQLMLEHFNDSGLESMGLPSGEQIMDTLSQFRPNVVMLDQVMPGKSGRELITEIRSHHLWSEIPIMMVTGLNSEADKVAALDLGADDYITKPFSLKEAVARAHALVRRSYQSHKMNLSTLVVGPVCVDFKSHRVTRDGEELQLTLTEFKILAELVKCIGQVVSRDRIRERALGNLNVSDRTIDVHMAAVRKKLGGVGEAIETVRGVGYRLTPRN